MEELLLRVLNGFEYDVMRQGSLPENAPYPETFFTFWNNDSADGNHYDGKEASVVWDYDVNLYSSDPALTYSLLEDAITRLKGNGFIITGRGHDVASDEITHTGRGVNVLFFEKI